MCVCVFVCVCVVQERRVHGGEVGRVPSARILPIGQMKLIGVSISDWLKIKLLCKNEFDWLEHVTDTDLHCLGLEVNKT